LPSSENVLESVFFNSITVVGAGAYDFLCKPVDIQTLKLLLHRCIHVVELEKQYRELQQSQKSGRFENLLAISSQMQTIFALIRKVVAST